MNGADRPSAFMYTGRTPGAVRWSREQSLWRLAARNLGQSHVLCAAAAGAPAAGLKIRSIGRQVSEPRSGKRALS